MSSDLPSVLITGTSTGMGNKTAIYLAQNGFRVYAGLRKEADFHLFETYDEITPVLLDVTNMTSIQKVYNEIAKDDNYFGLVNNAGVLQLQPILSTPISQLLDIFNVNLFGPIALIRTLYPLLKKSKGRIINISSINGIVPAPRDGGYSMSKHALEALSEQLQSELDPEVSISVIQPGLYDTAMVEKILEQLTPLVEMGDESVLQAIDFYSNKDNMRDPNLIAKTVHQILTTEKPKLRYVVGREQEEKLVIQALITRLVSISYSHPRTFDDFRDVLKQTYSDNNSTAT